MAPQSAARRSLGRSSERTSRKSPRRPRILSLTELPEELAARLEDGAELVVRPEAELSDGEVAERLGSEEGGYDGLLALLVHEVGETALGRTPLRVVANCAAGVDNVDLEAARRAGVAVTHTPGVLTEDVADLTWALLLAVVRRVVEGDRFVRSGRWAGWRPDLLLGRSLGSLTLGVVGAGRIGRAVLARAGAFGMRRLYASRSELPPEVEEELGARRRSLPELLAEADVVSLHVPLSGATRHLIDREALQRMKRGAWLINTARGPVVDEAALAEALDPGSGRLAGAGLDVFEHEPEIHPRLRELPNVVLLPHVGSATAETRWRMKELSVDSLRQSLIEGREPDRRVA
jgi:glyoxylate reductase